MRGLEERRHQIRVEFGGTDSSNSIRRCPAAGLRALAGVGERSSDPHFHLSACVQLPTLEPLPLLSAHSRYTPCSLCNHTRPGYPRPL